MRPDSSVYAFTDDLLDEGVAAALDRILGTPGPTGVTVAATYHASRDVFPHNPRSRVRFLDPGVYFRPKKRRYARTTLRPEPTSRYHDGDVDPLEVIRAATSTRGAGLHAWVVYLHDPPAGGSRPDVVQRNLYGDPMRTDLCPANPDVREYVVALTGDLARYGCDSLVAESIHYASFGHGYHHERCLVPLPPLEELLLGLCFCEHCVARGTAAGVDVTALHDWCRQRVDGVLEEAPLATACDPDLPREQVAALAGDELGGYLAVREDVVSELIAEASAALAGSGTRLCFQDPSVGIRGYATGEHVGGAAVLDAWRLGIDPARVAPTVGEYRTLGYARDPGRLATELAAVRRAVGPHVSLGCVLRPAPPDSDGADALAEKLQVLDEAHVEHVAFYHYGLLPLRRLADVHAALQRTAGEEPL